MPLPLICIAFSCKDIYLINYFIPADAPLYKTMVLLVNHANLRKAAVEIL